LLARWGYGTELPSDEARKLVQSMGVEITDSQNVFRLVRVKGEKTHLLPVEDRTKGDKLGDPVRDGQAAPLIDALHLTQGLYRKNDIGGIAAYLRDSGMLPQETF